MWCVRWLRFTVAVILSMAAQVCDCGERFMGVGVVSDIDVWMFAGGSVS